MRREAHRAELEEENKANEEEESDRQRALRGLDTAMSVLTPSRSSMGAALETPPKELRPVRFNMAID